MFNLRKKFFTPVLANFMGNFMIWKLCSHQNFLLFMWCNLRKNWKSTKANFRMINWPMKKRILIGRPLYQQQVWINNYSLSCVRVSSNLVYLWNHILSDCLKQVFLSTVIFTKLEREEWRFPIIVSNNKVFDNMWKAFSLCGEICFLCNSKHFFK